MYSKELSRSSYLDLKPRFGAGGHTTYIGPQQLSRFYRRGQGDIYDLEEQSI